MNKILIPAYRKTYLLDMIKKKYLFEVVPLGNNKLVLQNVICKKTIIKNIFIAISSIPLAFFVLFLQRTASASNIFITTTVSAFIYFIYHLFSTEKAIVFDGHKKAFYAIGLFWFSIKYRTFSKILKMKIYREDNLWDEDIDKIKLDFCSREKTLFGSRIRLISEIPVFEYKLNIDESNYEAKLDEGYNVLMEMAKEVKRLSGNSIEIEIDNELAD